MNKTIDKETKAALEKMISDGVVSRESAAKYFPELIESEGERIWIINYLNNRILNSTIIAEKENLKKAIAWLEKQGEQKSIWHNEDEEPPKDSLILLIMQSGTPIVAKIIEPNHTFNHGERWAYIDDLLEKQGEQKPAEKVEPKFKVGDIVKHKDNPHLTYILKRFTDDGDYEFHAIGKDGNEGCTCFSVVKYQDEWELVERKPLVKVEPKFHEGDWVVSKLDRKARQISEVHCDEYNEYYIVEGNGYDIEAYDRLHHLWTIQDAKDSDVLTTDMVIFIFKENKEGSVFMYCNYSVVSNSFSISNTAEVNEIYVHPSTKEQRDTLERAMTNAGYTFDFEKKELKKIEQNPVIEMKTSEESLGVDSDTYNKIVGECVYGEQNTAWSEVDEVGLANVMWAIKQARTIAKDENDMGNLWYAERWLKALKERVLPQPKQEWNEEDRKIIIELICIFESAIDGGYVGIPYRLIKDYIRVLKSCLHQNTWKPSDEQITWLYRATDEVRKDSRMKQVLNGLLCDLKKLREE